MAEEFAKKIEDEEIGAYLIDRLITMPFYLGRIVSGVIFFAMYMFLAEWSYYFVIPPSSSAVFWLPSGVTIAAFIRARWAPKIWPFWLVALFLGQFCVVIRHEVPLITSFIWSAANILLPAGVVLLSRHLVISPFDFRRIRDVFVFVAISSVALIPSSLLAGLGTVLGFKTPYMSSVISWATSDALGILLGAPMILSWSARGSKASGGFREGVILFLILSFLASYILYSESVILDQSYFSFLIFFVAWASIRFGPKGTSLVLIIVDLIAVWASIKGYGIFSGSQLSPSEKLFTLQLLVANIGFLMLLLAAAIEEQRFARINAEEALRMRDDFLSVASHELKTPLSSLSLQVQILNRYISQGRLKEIPEEKLMNLVKISEREIRRFSNLINGLLDVSRISAGRMNLNPEEINLTEVIEETVHRYKQDLDKSGCKVELLMDKNVKGYWDHMRIEQVITNLLSNAMKYGEGNPIEIKLEDINDRARFTVKDHGIGISEEDRARIFKRFERAVSISQFGGLGLGLYITKQIVDAHGGEIRVESEPGVGSSFIVDFPKAFLIEAKC